MKTNTVRYSCEITGDKVLLVIEGYLVGRYSFTFSVEECIEEFCERVGWEFKLATTTNEEMYSDSRVAGTFSFRYPLGRGIIATIDSQWSNDFTERIQ